MKKLRKDQHDFSLEELTDSGIQKGDRLEIFLKQGVDLKFDPEFNAYGYTPKIGMFDDKSELSLIGYVDRLYVHRKSYLLGPGIREDVMIFMTSAKNATHDTDKASPESPAWFVDRYVIYGWKKL